MTYTVAAFYRFATIADPAALKRDVRAACEAGAIIGTILIAHEGINGTIAGSAAAIETVIGHLRQDTRFADLAVKYSHATTQPFQRLKVKIKREIVTFGVPSANPALRTGTYVAPAAWNALISDPGVIVVDTRNAYEVAIGTFPGAIDPKTRAFGEFPAFAASHLDPARHKKVAMFCTGGIRCEKASAHLVNLGFEEVYHLEGGILKYLETITPDESLWRGECFVFDERVALDHGVVEGRHILCRSCGNAVVEGDECSVCAGPAPAIWSAPMTASRASSLVLTGLDEPALTRLAELAAFSVRAGDTLALSGDLGAGKTTFARAFIRAMAHPAPVDVPSPTFTLVQTYDTARLSIAHLDLYRLSDPRELDELGLDDLVARGAVLVEWPERAGGPLPGMILEIALGETAGAGDTRDVTLTAHDTWIARLDRLRAIRAFLGASGNGAAEISYLQGDASPRRYARLTHPDRAGTILMDWPQQPDGPPIRDGLPYSRLAHLAEGVRPFVAIADALRVAGCAAPEVFAYDLDQGLLVLEDLGDGVFGTLVKAGFDQRTLWRAGVDALIDLRAVAVPPVLPVRGGGTVALPRYDAQAFGIETELLLDWYWPALHGAPVPDAMRSSYLALWASIFERLATLPHGLALRDYHSPNLLWLPQRSPRQQVGMIDFQDAQIGPHAYDLVSLLQDARVDVPAALEAELLAHYCDEVARRDPSFDEAAFRWSYAALGAQRNAKILGIFARLAHRDGKPGYLAHIPRIWTYLARDLAHPGLAGLQEWFDTAFPSALRDKPISPKPPPPARAPA